MNPYKIKLVFNHYLKEDNTFRYDLIVEDRNGCVLLEEKNIEKMEAVRKLAEYMGYIE